MKGRNGISASPSGVPLKPGMVVSNEPGVYFENKYGIRIENLCLIEEKISANESATQHGPFYGLSDLTIVPYARNLIDITLLNQNEIEQVNQYHQEIADRLSQHLEADVKKWLIEATKPLC